VRTAIAIAWLGGCASVPATQVIVSVDAEPFFVRQTATLRLEVWNDERVRTEIAVDLGSSDFPVRLPLVPLDGQPSRTFEVVATAIDGSGEALGRVRALGGYVEDEVRTIELVLEEACVTVRCGPAQTCSAGGCRDACARSAARLPAICGAGCGSDVECPGGRCDSGACAIVASCEELEARGLRESGLYAIDLDGAGARAPELAYCEMSADGGGWTLVARSAGIETVAEFGWSGGTGDVLDEASPYSLDATGIDFSEVLFGEHAGGHRLGDRAYVAFVGPGFVGAHADDAISIRDGLRTVAGECEPRAEGFMFSLAGFTSAAGYYFFRDNDMREEWGLTARGFKSSDPSCDRSGELDGRHGLLFVR
jgi:hypothetical protein